MVQKRRLGKCLLFDSYSPCLASRPLVDCVNCSWWFAGGSSLMPVLVPVMLVLVLVPVLGAR